MTGRRTPAARALPLLAAALALSVAPTATQEAPPALALYRLVPGGARADWSAQGNRVAYDKTGPDGYRDVYVALSDGGSERCLTCDLEEFRKVHAGSPVWHPSGRFLVFRSERPFRTGGKILPYLSAPGGHRGSDLWAIEVDGHGYAPLVNRASQGMRLGAPRFSHEGDRLAWSERRVSGGGLWGKWILRVARLSTRRGLFRLQKVESHSPNLGGFVESYGFTTDDRWLVLGAGSAGAEDPGIDLFRLRLEDDSVERLTDEAPGWSRFARLSPDGVWIAWGSSAGFERPIAPFRRGQTSAALRTELWLMRSRGERRRRLTSFNDPGNPYFAGPVMVGPAAWSRDGNRLLVTVTSVLDPGSTNLFVLELRSLSRS